MNEQFYKLINRVEELKSIRDETWRQACNYDEIPRYELFIVFSKDNPFVATINECGIELGKLYRALAALTYSTAVEIGGIMVDKPFIGVYA